MNFVGLFAGIGGIELGLNEAGHRASLMCEIDPAARAVLAERFPDLPVHEDIRALRKLPKGTELIAGGLAEHLPKPLWHSPVDFRSTGLRWCSRSTP